MLIFTFTINVSKPLFIQANTNNIDFLRSDKSNNKIAPLTSTSFTNLVPNTYIQLVRKLSTDNNMGNVNLILNYDDREDIVEEYNNTDYLVKFDKLSNEHYIFLSGDEFYESHFK